MPFHPDFNIVAKALHQFYADSVNADQPVVHQQEPEQIISELKLEHYVREGGLEAGALKEFLETYFSYVTRLHHPHYLGHQCAPPHYASALGTFITGFANTVSSIYEMGPASVSIEFFVLNWMLEKIGWDPVPNDRIIKDTGVSHGGGILVNGGSIANLTALLIARTRAYPGVWQEGCPADLAIMLPSESHYSLTKAAGILGIGSKAVFHLASDKQGKVLPDKIPEILKKIKDNGQIPMALVANACSTPVGMYDPLEEIGEICNEHGVWFHVDGAHGASALISEKHKGLLKGIGNADSLVWDAHKLLQTPSLCAALLVRDHQFLDGGIALHQDASYLFHEKKHEAFDSIHRTIETTKSGLGEPLFFVLGSLGEKGLAEYIDRQYQLTKEAYDYIRGCPYFECPALPESNILCFRVAGGDKLQLDIRNHLINEGSFYITTVVFKGKRFLRLVFMSSSTTLETVKVLVTEILKLREKFTPVEMR